MTYDLMWDAVNFDLVWDNVNDEPLFVYDHDAIVQSLAIRIKFSKNTNHLINLNIHEMQKVLYKLMQEIDNEEAFVKVGSVSVTQDNNLKDFVLKCKTIENKAIEVAFSLTTDGVVV